jgi:hypothetical protein
MYSKREFIYLIISLTTTYENEQAPRREFVSYSVIKLENKINITLNTEFSLCTVTP